VLLLLNNNLSVLTVLDQTQPPASALMVHNHNLYYNNNLVKHLEIELLNYKIIQ
jgi:hypothetical protein